MITNQTKEELLELARDIQPHVVPFDIPVCHRAAGLYRGNNMTDCIWVKNGLNSSFFFVSPCLRDARAETFITQDAKYEFTFHALDRYRERNDKHNKVKVMDAHNERWSRVVQNIADFAINEKIIGTVGSTLNRGCVVRTTNGVLLCSDKSLHKGVLLVNTYIPYSELKDTQKMAVDYFDRGLSSLSKYMYSKYFVNRRHDKMKYNVVDAGGKGTIRVKKATSMNSIKREHIHA